MKLENGTPIIINKRKGTFVSLRESAWDGVTVIWMDENGVLQKSSNPDLKLEEARDALREKKATLTGFASLPIEAQKGPVVPELLKISECYMNIDPDIYVRLDRIEQLLKRIVNE